VIEVWSTGIGRLFIDGLVWDIVWGVSLKVRRDSTIQYGSLGSHDSGIHGNAIVLLNGYMDYLQQQQQEICHNLAICYRVIMSLSSNFRRQFRRPLIFCADIYNSIQVASRLSSATFHISQSVHLQQYECCRVEPTHPRWRAVAARCRDIIALSKTS
jgi:hypothetical protein